MQELQFEFSLGVPLGTGRAGARGSSSASLARRRDRRARPRLAAGQRNFGHYAGRDRRAAGVHARTATPRAAANPVDARCVSSPACGFRRAHRGLDGAYDHRAAAIEKKFCATAKPAGVGRAGITTVAGRRLARIAPAHKRRISGRQPVAAGAGCVRIAGVRWAAHGTGPNLCRNWIEPSRKCCSPRNRRTRPF